MAELQQAMRTPIPAGDFMRARANICALRKKYPHVSGECCGCYVLMQDGKPAYAGISREVYRRVFRILKEANHTSSTLANMFADMNVPLPGVCCFEKMHVPAYRAAHERAHRRIAALDVAIVPIEGAMELYLFGAYCAQHLRVPLLNVFRFN